MSRRVTAYILRYVLFWLCAFIVEIVYYNVSGTCIRECISMVGMSCIVMTY